MHLRYGTLIVPLWSPFTHCKQLSLLILINALNFLTAYWINNTNMSLEINMPNILVYCQV